MPGPVPEPRPVGPSPVGPSPVGPIPIGPIPIGPIPSPQPFPAPAPYIPPPADLADVRVALRLGWHVAELRGLYDASVYHDADPTISFPDSALRLADEWPRAGRAQETERVVRETAARLQLDLALKDLQLEQQDVQRVSSATSNTNDASDSAPLSLDSFASAAIETLRHRLLQGDTMTNDESAWRDFSWFLRCWDEEIQNQLTGRSPQLAAGYRLGRATAEIRWAIHDGAPDSDATSWSHLLGRTRRAMLVEHIYRLAQ